MTLGLVNASDPIGLMCKVLDNLDGAVSFIDDNSMGVQ